MSIDNITVIQLVIVPSMSDERYLEDDDKLHKKLVVSCDLATEPMQEPQPEDDSETKALILHERLLAY